MKNNESILIFYTNIIILYYYCKFYTNIINAKVFTAYKAWNILREYPSMRLYLSAITLSLLLSDCNDLIIPKLYFI